MNYEKLMAKSKFFLKIQYVRYGTVVTMPIVTLVPCLLSHLYHAYCHSRTIALKQVCQKALEQVCQQLWNSCDNGLPRINCLRVINSLL